MPLKRSCRNYPWTNVAGSQLIKSFNIWFRLKCRCCCFYFWMKYEFCIFFTLSWEEMGKYDHPAVFKFIHKQNPQKIIYIGHSMGCTTFTVMAIERPDIAKMFKGMIALAPAVYINHIKTPLSVVAPLWRAFQVCNSNQLSLTL